MEFILTSLWEDISLLWSSYSSIILLFIVCIIFFQQRVLSNLISKEFDTESTEVELKNLVDPYGYIKPKLCHLERIRYLTKPRPSGHPFPATLKEFICHPTYLNIASWLRNKFIMSPAGDDCRRAITIASILNNFSIPAKLFCLDAETVRLYDRLRAELYLSFLKPEVVIDKSTRFSEGKLPTENYKAIARDFIVNDSIASLFLQQSTRHTFGTFDSFINSKQVMKHLEGFTPEFRIELLKSFLTAYATTNVIAIPDSYTHFGTMTLAFMEEYQNLSTIETKDDFKFKLSVVK